MSTGPGGPLHDLMKRDVLSGLPLESACAACRVQGASPPDGPGDACST